MEEKGEHGSKGGAGFKGRQQVENSVMDEGQGRKKRRETRERLVEMMQRGGSGKGRGGGR